MSSAIGKSYARMDGYEKVTGQAAFVADLNLGRVLHARIVRSTHAHARITKLETSQARQIPGVKAIITAEMLPGRIGHAIQDHNVIARNKVRYWGEPVAVVVANDVDTAVKAAQQVKIEYEPLPVVLHPRDAAQASAPLIHEHLDSYPHEKSIHPVPGTNIAHRYRLVRGEVQEEFSHAHLVLENEYWVPWIAHVQIEPHVAVSQWDGESLSIWTSSQSAFFVRDTVAKLLSLSPSRVRVAVPYVGGGFGGKSDVTVEPLLAIVARVIPGFPIQLVLTREEAFAGSVIGRGAWGRIKHAVDADGRLLAEETELYFGCGGYADYSVWVAQGGGHNSTGPYYIPNLYLLSHCVYTNTSPTGAYRGYGHPEVHWMIERQMDQIARKLGMDPVELRLKNLLAPGKENSLGQTMQNYNGRADLCLKAVVDGLGNETVPTVPGRIRAQGIASFMKSPVMRSNAQSGAILRFNEDGTVSLFTGAAELGQGVETVLSQIAAEALEMPFDRIHYTTSVDTSYSPYEWQTVASHTTWAVGNAVRMAAEDALQQLRIAAAQVFETSEDDLEIRNACIWVRDQPEKMLPYQRLGIGYTRPDGSAVNPPIVGRGTFVATGLTHPDPDTGQGNLAASWTFGCQGVDLEVDPDSGRIYVLRMVSAQDAGRIINPQAARGQVEGAMIMALGAALMEKLKFSPDGQMLNPGFVDYRIPTSADIPDLKVIFIETEDASGPFGARGLGEHGIVAIPPAIGNALANALGAEFYEIPITPEMVWEYLRMKDKSESMKGGV